MRCFSLLFWNSFAHFTIYAVSSAKTPIKDYVCVNLCEQIFLNTSLYILVWVVVFILMRIVSDKNGIYIINADDNTPKAW